MSKYIECGRSGIYFLLHKGVVVYIGSTTDFPRRIVAHYDKKFDSIRFIECSNIKSYEMRCMRLFKPKYNSQLFSKDMRESLISEGKFNRINSRFIDY